MTVRVGALTPNYLTVDPTTGAVGADFTGVVNAQGITLPAFMRPTAGTPLGGGPVNKVNWTRTSDGAMIGYLVSQEDAAGIDGAQPRDRAIVAALEATSGNQSSAELMAIDRNGAVQAFLAAIQQGAGTTASVFASAGNSPNYTIVDQNGSSSFAIMGNGGAIRAQIWQQQSNGISLGTAAGAGVSTIFSSNGWVTTGNYHPILWLQDNGAGFLPHCTFAITGITSNTLKVGIVNPAGTSGTPAGNILLVMLTGN